MRLIIYAERATSFAIYFTMLPLRVRAADDCRRRDAAAMPPARHSNRQIIPRVGGLRRLTLILRHYARYAY